MKKPPAPKNKKIVVIGAAVVLVILAIGGGYFLYRRSASPVKVLDQFPIMLINDGKTAVYRQIKMSKDAVTSEIVISNTTEEKQATKIYEVIPKEVAEKASDLEYSLKPTVIEEDPIILWDLGPLEPEEPVKIEYSFKKRMEDTLCVEKNYFSEMEKLGLNAFYFDDCTKFIEMRYQEAVERNRKLREQELNDKVRLVNPNDAEYQEIQKAAKATIGLSAKEQKTTRKGCQGSKEEVIAKIRQEYNEVNVLGTYGGISAECDGVCNKDQGRWQIVCSRPSFKTQYTEWESWFTFYVGDPDGKVRKVGNYGKKRDYDVINKVWKDWETYGQPQFGVM